MSKKGNTTRSQERKRKTAMARAAGLDKPSSYRDKSWEELKELAKVRPEDERYFKERFTTDGMTRSEALTYKRRMLREAGFTPEEATKHRTKPIEDVMLLINTKRTQQPEKAKKLYEPFDKDYRHNYAYQVTYIVVDEEENEFMKFVTITRPYPMSEAEVQQQFYEYMETNLPEYGTVFKEIVEIKSMFAGQGGGASAERKNKLGKNR